MNHKPRCKNLNYKATKRKHEKSLWLKGMLCACSVISDSVTPWTVARQAPLSMGFCRQEHWLLLLLSRFSRVQLFVTSQTAAHQAPLSLGFSRQKYWGGLPFPSPTQACMLSCFSRVWLCATPWTAAHQAPLSMGFSRQEHGVGCHFLLQRIFPIQGLNPNLLHCRQILYHLCHQSRQRFFGQNPESN